MNAHRPAATLSFDLDNKWSYMKTHSDPGWERYPSYLPIVIPRVLDFLRERNLTITFFVVGQDAALEENHAALSAIAAAGHEIGNHSFYHEPWLHLAPEQQIEDELRRAEYHIQQVTGQRPVGFRGPGYVCSEALLRVLERLGYVYDASTLPTFAGPLARTYYFLTATLSPEEKAQRSKLFGTLKDGLRPLRPYRWRLESEAGRKGLLEIPVTTMPVLRTPFHCSYIMYMSTFSPKLALTYFRLALRLCSLRGVQPSFLLHPLDFLGCDDMQELGFFPAMGLTSQRKAQIVNEVLRLFCQQYSVLTLREYASTIVECPEVQPHFYTNPVQA